MPIYEYECNGCGAHHEFLQKFSDSPKRKCPSCGKSRLRKMVSAASFRLKGTGWYVTDFRDKNKPADKNQAQAETKGNGKGNGKSAEASTSQGSGSTGKDSTKPSTSKSETSSSKTPA